MGTRSPSAATRHGSTAGDLLSRRALNRATLARQFLLERSGLSALEMVERLVGLQAQAPFPPYFGLWSRLVDFRPEELVGLFHDRSVVRMALMRSTIHLVSGRDARMLRPLIQPVLNRSLSGTFARPIQGLDIEALTAAGRALVEEQPRTFGELGALLRERWPDRDAGALAAAVRTTVPLVQVPPRGLWGESGKAAHTSVESWLGAPLDPRPAAEGLVRRYLAAFGPASVLDVQQWSGLTRLGEVVERLRPGLRCFRDENGRALFDLPEAPRPDPDTPAPVRFVAEFDNLLLSHADRTRVIAAEHRPAVFTVNGVIPGTVLVDGFAHGTWRITRQRRGAVLRIRPFGRVPSRVRSALTAEGARLLAFAVPDAEPADIEFTDTESTSA